MAWPPQRVIDNVTLTQVAGVVYPAGRLSAPTVKTYPLTATGQPIIAKALTGNDRAVIDARHRFAFPKPHSLPAEPQSNADL
jgi:hypothetical protein